MFTPTLDQFTKIPYTLLQLFNCHIVTHSKQYSYNILKTDCTVKYFLKNIILTQGLHGFIAAFTKIA